MIDVAATRKTQARLAAGVRHTIERATAEALPREMVGLLGGVRTAHGWHVERFVRLADAACTEDRFDVSAPAFAVAEAALRQGGLAWLGFAHSHPRGAAVPSLADRTRLWRGCLQLVAAPAGAGTGITLGAFVLVGEHVLAVELVGERTEVAP